MKDLSWCQNVSSSAFKLQIVYEASDVYAKEGICKIPDKLHGHSSNESCVVILRFTHRQKASKMNRLSN